MDKDEAYKQNFFLIMKNNDNKLGQKKSQDSSTTNKIINNCSNTNNKQNSFDTNNLAQIAPHSNYENENHSHAVFPPHIKEDDLKYGRIASGEEILDALIGHLPRQQTRRNDGRLRDGYLGLWDEHLSHGGIIFEGESLIIDGETLIDASVQVKLFKPRKTKEGALIKYESPRRSKSDPTLNPKGEGVFLPKFTPEAIEAIEAQWGVKITSWEEVCHHLTSGKKKKNIPDIPIIVTEGIKKAMAAMEMGYLAISVPGCYGAIRNDSEKDTKRLVDGLKVFCNRKREFILAFDQDEKPSTIEKVEKAAIATYFTFKKLGMEISFLKWDHSQGKGLDDFIEGAGKEALDEIFHDRQSLEEVRLNKYSSLENFPKTEVNERFLDPQILIDSKEQIIFVKGNKGTGKSQAIKSLLAFLANSYDENHPMKKKYPISHRRTLARALAKDNNIIFINDVKNHTTECQKGYSICWDSLYDLNLKDFEGAILVLDEIDQSVTHLLTAETQVAKNRVSILHTFTQIVKTVISTGGKIIAASADLALCDINLITSIAGKDVPSKLIINHYNPIKEQNRNCYFYEAESDLIEKAILTVKEMVPGQRILFACDAMGHKSKISTTSLEHLFKALFVDKKILRLDSNTIVEFIQKYGSLQELLTRGINEHDIILLSPVGETGISLDTPDQFIKVFGHFCGTLTVNSALQILERYRGSADRHVFFKTRGFNQPTFGNTVGSIMNHVVDKAKDKKSPLYEVLKYLKEADNLAQFIYEGDHARSFELAFSQIVAKRNNESWVYRKRAKSKLKKEGYNLIEVEASSDSNLIKPLLTNNRNVNYAHYRDLIASLPLENDEKHKQLKNKDAKVEAEINLERTNNIARKFKIVQDTSDSEIVEKSEDLKDSIVVSEEVFSDLVAIDDKRTYKKMTKLATTIKGLEEATRSDLENLNYLEENQKREFSFDFLRKNKSELAQLLTVLGVADFLKNWLSALDFESQDYPNMIAAAREKWNKERDPVSKNSDHIEKIAAIAREPFYRATLKRILGITITVDPESPKGSPVAILNQILKPLGLTLTQVGKKGSRGFQEYFYSEFLEFNLPKLVDTNGTKRKNLAIPYLVHTLKHLVGYYKVSQNMVSKSFETPPVDKWEDLNIEKLSYLATENLPPKEVGYLATENLPHENPPPELKERIATFLGSLKKGAKVAILTAFGWLEGAVKLVGIFHTMIAVNDPLYNGFDKELNLSSDFLTNQPEYLDRVKLIGLDELGELEF